MDQRHPFWSIALERLLGLALVVLLCPALLSAALAIAVTGGNPIVLTDAVTTDAGKVTKTYRFRTTGNGTPAFRTLGRFLRQYAIDDMPGLWSVVRGDACLSDVLKGIFS